MATLDNFTAWHRAIDKATSHDPYKPDSIRSAFGAASIEAVEHNLAEAGSQLKVAGNKA